MEEGVAKARTALEKTTDAHLMKPWKFMMGGRVVNQEPRYVMVLNSVFSHLAHHRGQLTVYLRLNDAKVPAIFGPSADEKF
ncbi:MAG: DinB family protein [Acidobacteriaceae bacterium]